MGQRRRFGSALALSATCTSEGFSLFEVLTAVCLSLALLLCTGPLWSTVGRTAAETHTRLLDAQRWGVVAARFESDLRLASTEGRGDLGCVSLLEATATRVVLVTRAQQGDGLEVVAWEFAGGSLMRRRSPLPPESPRPSSVSFPDNKTMIEGVLAGRFSYWNGSAELGAAVGRERLRQVTAIRAACTISATGGGRRFRVETQAALGR